MTCRNFRFHLNVLTMVLGASMAGASLAQTAATPAQSPAASATGMAPAKSMPRTDKKFIEKAAMGGMVEVALGNLAQQKASSDPVKQFGAQMVTDHSKANDDLKQLASAKGVSLPGALDRSHQKDVDRLGKLAGADFDREYMKHMVSDHKKDVSEFKSEAKSGKDEEIKSFASKTLPTLEQHLQTAQSTYDQVKSGKMGEAMSSGTSSSMRSDAAKTGKAAAAASGASR
jgi:putative membrane protein